MEIPEYSAIFQKELFDFLETKYGYKSRPTVYTVDREFDHIMHDHLHQQLTVPVHAYQRAKSQIEYEEAYELILEGKKNVGYVYVTVNPKPKTPFHIIKESVEKLVNQDNIEWAYWCYETTPTSHIHSHILLKMKKMDKNFVNRKVKPVFVPQICQTNRHVYIKYPTDLDVKKVMEYIGKQTAPRAGSKKRPAYDATIKWRSENNLQPFYQLNLPEHALLV